MTKADALKKLEGKTGWLVRESSGSFAVMDCKRDPWWTKEAMYLGTPGHKEAAAEWLASGKN